MINPTGETMTIVKFLASVLLILSLGCQSKPVYSGATLEPPVIAIQPVSTTKVESTPSQVTSSPGVQDVTFPAITLTEISRGLEQPLYITHAGDGSGRLFVVEKAGRIKIFHGNLYQGIFLDIHTKVSGASEQGLLSVAFPPGYGTSGHFYVDYTNLDGDTVIARYQVGKDSNAADPDSETILLTIAQPYANHNGGQLAFGPNGYLYIGMGDGGSAGDPGNRAQNPSELLGKILRIDVEYPRSSASSSGNNRSYSPIMFHNEVNKPYLIPPDNPYINTPNYRPEIWALGLRNPWRFSFDRMTGDLYIADVGQDAWEEVDFQPAAFQGGQNFGWHILEATHCYNPPSGCVPPAGYVAPVLEYPHGINDSNGCSITGGYVYRGSDHPSMQDFYFYADYCTGRIWGAINNGGWQSSLLTIAPTSISSFGEDEAGNIYIAGFGNGRIYKIVPTV